MPAIEFEHLPFQVIRYPESKVKTLARKVLPPPVRRVMRDLVYGRPPKLPLKENFVLAVDGLQANFFIANRSDLGRIVGKYETAFRRDMASTFKDHTGGVFLDIGAAQGVYSILAAAAGMKVYAFDPDPISIVSLRKNILANPGIKDLINIQPFALGERQGQVVLQVDTKAYYAPSLQNTSKEFNGKIMVDMFSVDDLIREGKMPVPDVVKIDVEGAEGLVLQGMFELMQGCQAPKDVFLEIHTSYLPLFGSSALEVAQTMLDNGYRTGTVPHQRGNEILCHFVKI